MEAARFTEHFRSANGLGERDLREWVLYPGMLFGATQEWWGDRRIRRAPHEGLDLCTYRDGREVLRALNEHSKIPVLYSGVVTGIIDDFLGKSLIVKHSVPDTGIVEFCTIYGHTAPGSNIYIGRAVEQGAVIARLADASLSTSKAVPHLHLSIALSRKAISYGQLDWGAIGDPDTMTLIDPLQLMDRYCLLPETA
jgi:hypothetical protein